MTDSYPTLGQIASQLAGYDPQALRAEKVGEFLASLAEPVTQTTTRPLREVLGSVLAADIIAPIDVPPHDNAAMDGYAFCANGWANDHPLSLDITGTAYAGEDHALPVLPGQCVRIMTGAIMPTGLDTVAPQELVTVHGQRITIPAGFLRAGDNRRLRGEDLQQGAPALTAGTRITPAALGLLASLGRPQVEVFRTLRVAFFSTGDEILSLGEAPRPGAVYDSNRFTLLGLLTRLGVEPIDMGVVKDDPPALEAAFGQAAATADVIITSGGVSVGEADHTKAVMRRLAGGPEGVAFWRVAMRPGRPMAVGRIGQSILFGLPGNPVAVMVTFLAFVRPALLKMMGCHTTSLPMLRARSAEAIRKKAGRTEYQRGIVGTGPTGELQVHTTGQQGSGVLSSMTAANGLIVLHHDQGDVAKGDLVDVMMFEGVY